MGWRRLYVEKKSWQESRRKWESMCLRIAAWDKYLCASCLCKRTKEWLCSLRFCLEQWPFKELETKASGSKDWLILYTVLQRIPQLHGFPLHLTKFKSSVCFRSEGKITYNSHRGLNFNFHIITSNPSTTRRLRKKKKKLLRVVITITRSIFCKIVVNRSYQILNTVTVTL